MASKVLYPPIVDSYMPAFPAMSGENSYCDVYFRLSKFNSKKDFKSVHVTIVKQDTNMNVVKKIDNIDNNRYRSTGIILNIKANEVLGEENLYFIRLYTDDLTNGWQPDWIYKIQIRLSMEDYDPSKGIGQAAWLNGNSSYFSEWSTICVIKAINKITYTIDALNIDTSNENESNDNIQTFYSSTLMLSGHFDNCGSENIYSYNFILYDENDGIIENSRTIYANKFQDNKSFNYLMKHELENGKIYKLEFKFETANHYIGGAYKYTTSDGAEVDNRYVFEASVVLIDTVNCTILLADNDAEGRLKGITSVHEEEEEGRMGIKLISNDTDPFSGNLCIRRASSRDNFQTWTDIKILVVKEQDINQIPIFYDYTIESGVWYKYAVQQLDKEGNRGIMNITPAALRNFNYSFLLGKNNQQLKLMFDNSMNSYKIQMQESRVDPIGATFPIVTRNAATKYRTFPLNGLITIWMDEKNTFCNKKVIYEYEDIVDLYKRYNENNNIVQYDYIYERDFRQLVLEFLHDGEFKLFKSPTEGNIIIRITDINCTPNQSLDRMIYNFSSTAQEMAEATMENYLKYGFYEVGTYASDFSVAETKIGQIQADFAIGENIFDRIYQKYDSQGKNLGGYIKTLQSIHHIKITFDGKPLRIQNSSGEVVLGNNFRLNGKLFSVYAPVRMYEFDNRLIYTPLDSLVLLGEKEENNNYKKVTTVSATIDFLYDISTEVYQKKQIQERTVKDGIGQLFNEYAPNEDLYNEIYYKYYIEGERTFRRLNNVSSIEIEANPGVTFLIKDESDATAERHTINATGTLNLFDLSNIVGLKYLGYQDSKGVLHTDVKTNILVNYAYVLTKGSYKVIS